MSKPIIFNGSIPQHYEDYLTPFLFNAYADDLVQRIDASGISQVLELACGTGCVTKRLLAHLPPTVQLTATDLQADMLDVAKRNISYPNVTWDTVDMTNIPYASNRFDLIVCQFGLMLVPEKLSALTEMHRVLKTGGRLLFNVWSNIEHNPVWNIAGQVIESTLGVNPILQDPGPFSLGSNSTTLQLLEQTGFSPAAAGVVQKTGTMETAAIAAKGLIEGLPVFVALHQKNPSLAAETRSKLEYELIRQLGDHPLQSNLEALVFETNK